MLVVVFGMRESKLKSAAQAIERTISSNEIKEAHQKITALQPKPLKVRLRSLLEQINSKIIPSVKDGHFGFEGGINPTLYYDLLHIAAEPGAEQFVTVDPHVKTGIGTGPGGSDEFGVIFKVYPKILDNERNGPQNSDQKLS